MRARTFSRTLFSTFLVFSAARLEPVVAQAPSPTFEVTSVRPVTGVQGQGVNFLPTGRFTALNLTLRDLIALAYGPARQPLPAARVIGGPDWIASERFNVEAVAPGPVAPDPAFDGFPGAMFGMLQSLLADRFRLAIRKETRDTPVYVLVRLRADGALGPGMRASTNGCSTDNSAPAGGASIFTAVQEQLGLRLESRRMPVEVVIVERAERPTEN